MNMQKHEISIEKDYEIIQQKVEALESKVAKLT